MNAVSAGDGQKPHIDRAADRLLQAWRTKVPCEPVRDLLGRNDATAAYAVQQRLVEARLAAGATIVGRKVGLTSAAVRAQLGVDQPDFGFLFDDMLVAGSGPVALDALLQPRIEAEIAFVLSSDLEDGPLDLNQVSRAVEYVVASMEIVDSRIARWDISFADTVADNASSGAFVLGSHRRALSGFSAAHAEMSMAVNGQTVSTGDGSACLGNPVEALRWLAVTARSLGQPLRAGQVVLSGALGPMWEVRPGDRVTAVISGLGIVETVFEREQASIHAKHSNDEDGDS